MLAALTQGSTAVSGVTWLPDVSLLAVGLEFGGFYLWNPYQPFAPLYVAPQQTGGPDKLCCNAAAAQGCCLGHNYEILRALRRVRL